MNLEPQAGDRWQRAGQHDIVVTGVENSVVSFQQQDRQFRLELSEYLRLVAGCVQKGDTLVRNTETEDFLFE